ncbi:hypothetical protein EDD21DRAFT_392661 [Dissophora ornata]|nr:hypothetical protein EDD21DRAFT_392661 [Dissophora ornata]
MSSTTFQCSDCRESFSSRSQLRAHVLERHSQECEVVLVAEDGLLTTTSLVRIDGHFVCPRCSLGLSTKSGIRKHVGNNLCKRDLGNADNSEDSNDGGSTPPLLEPTVVPNTTFVPPVSDETFLSQRRTFDDAVLAACQKLQAPSSEQETTLLFMKHLGMRAVSFADVNGAEQQALVHSSVVHKLAVGQSCVHAIGPEPKKRKSEDRQCEMCTPKPVVGLEHIMSISPYSKLILSRKYVEINDAHCDLLNQSWIFQPELRFACARLLAGCIVLNGMNGQAVIVNTVEVYGRPRQVDSHREHAVLKKQTAVTTSLPPPVGTRYTDVWPLTISALDGERLVIGTQSFNALVTSSLRLDVEEPPSLGGATMNFTLSTPQASHATKIFLDSGSIEDAYTLASNKDAWCVSTRDTFSQLRQLRTKFHDSSTYSLCRASSFFTRNSAQQPFTIFNLLSCDQMRKGNGTAVATVFYAIAKTVLEKGTKSSLDKSTIERAKQECSDGSAMATAIDNILSLFHSETAIPILGNCDLNKALEKLADQAASFVSTANKTSAGFVKQSFHYMG